MVRRLTIPVNKLQSLLRGRFRCIIHLYCSLDVFSTKKSALLYASSWPATPTSSRCASMAARALCAGVEVPVRLAGQVRPAFLCSHRSRSAASVHLLHGNINDVHHQSLLPLSSPTHEEDHTEKKKEAIYI